MSICVDVNGICERLITFGFSWLCTIPCPWNSGFSLKTVLKLGFSILFLMSVFFLCCCICYYCVLLYCICCSGFGTYLLYVGFRSVCGYFCIFDFVVCLLQSCTFYSLLSCYMYFLCGWVFFCVWWNWFCPEFLMYIQSLIVFPPLVDLFIYWNDYGCLGRFLLYLLLNFWDEFCL